MVFLLFWNIKELSADLIDDLSLKSNLGISLIKKLNISSIELENPIIRKSQ